jgi:hypothetical protein
VASNSLIVTNLELAAQWHPTKNGSLRPSEVLAGSRKKVWWKCEQGHEWEALLVDRKNGRGCPYCARRRVDSKNCLAVTHPGLAAEWHPIKNGNLTPYDVLAGSNKEVWWKCPKVEDHEWLANISERAAGNGCSCCRGLTIVESNCLATTHPLIAAQWHPTKNESLTPRDVGAGNRSTRVWWKCPAADDHEWSSTPADRTNKVGGCPFCRGLRVARSNCLATTHPDIAQEWHPTKNGSLTPASVVAGSGKKVWWICPKGHQWKTSVMHRALSKTGCPYCANKLVDVTVHNAGSSDGAGCRSIAA